MTVLGRYAQLFITAISRPSPFFTTGRTKGWSILGPAVLSINSDRPKTDMWRVHKVGCNS